jgi:hypothetical protein
MKPAMRTLPVLLLVCGLQGCASYQEAHNPGDEGYRSSFTAPNYATVSYQSKGIADRHLLRSFARRRIAEIAVEHDFDYYRVLRMRDVPSLSAYGHYTFHIHYEVEMFKGRPPASQLHVDDSEIYVVREPRH